jgi:hypothetical protein
MPALEAEVIGRCPHCRVRVKVNDNGTTPWHTVGIFTCDGVDRKAVDIEKPKAGKS